MCKKLISLLMAIAMLLSVVGCVEDEEPSKKQPVTKPNVSDSDNESDGKDKDDAASSENEEAAKDTVIVTEVPKKTRPEQAANNIKKEFTLGGDTTVKDEIKLGKYKLVWSEEFNGNSLNTDKIAVLTNDGEGRPDIYIDNNLTFVSDGVVTMRVQRYYDPENTTAKYACGPGLSTHSTLNWERGYIEMRAKVPYRESFWSAFWFRSATSNNGFGEPIIDQHDYIKQFANYAIEIDIFEVFGSWDTASPNMHTWGFDELKGVHTRNSAQRDRYTFDDPTNLNEEYHVYGFSWDDKEMAMYIDGEKYNTYDLNKSFDQYGMEGYKRNVVFAMWGNGIVTDSTAGADGVGILRADTEEVTDLPCDYSIDWIRLYQDPNDSVSRFITGK